MFKLKTIIFILALVVICDVYAKKTRKMKQSRGSGSTSISTTSSTSGTINPPESKSLQTPHPGPIDGDIDELHYLRHPGCEHDEIVDISFEDVDTDGDEAISLDEAANAIAKISRDFFLPPNFISRGDLEVVFQESDNDGDGNINEEEYRRFFDFSLDAAISSLELVKGSPYEILYDVLSALRDLNAIADASKEEEEGKDNYLGYSFRAMANESGQISLEKASKFFGYLIGGFDVDGSVSVNIKVKVDAHAEGKTELNEEKFYAACNDAFQAIIEFLERIKGEAKVQIDNFVKEHPAQAALIVETEFSGQYDPIIEDTSAKIVENIPIVGTYGYNIREYLKKKIKNDNQKS